MTRAPSLLSRRTKILRSNLWRHGYHHGSLVIDSIYVSLCIELGFDSSYELLTGILGVAYVAGTLMAGVAVVVADSSLVPG